MKTILPQTTISYNSRQFLVDTLDRLVSNKIISFYCFIEHQPEDDEKKKHIHLYIEPVNKIDTATLPDLFKEIDLSNPNQKPLKILPLQTCRSWPDWFWYSLHNAQYLFNKGETRRYHYDIGDLVSNDYDDLENRINETPFPKSEYDKIEEMVNQGYSTMAIIKNCNIPVRWYGLYKKFIEDLINEKTNRGNKDNHEFEDF